MLLRMYCLRGVAERLEIPGADLRPCSAPRRRAGGGAGSRALRRRAPRDPSGARSRRGTRRPDRHASARPARLSRSPGIALDVVELVGIGRRMDELESRRDGSSRSARSAPSARYSPIASSWPSRPARCGARLRPSIDAPSAPASPPARSTSVGRTSTQRNAARRRGAARSGRGSRRPAARGSRLRRSSSCTRGRARRASRRDR